MSFELMWEDEDPCPCGLGTVIWRFEADDWNRSRKSRQILCSSCLREDELRQQQAWEAEKQREERRQRARALAEERYLQRWLDRFHGCSLKEVWLLYTHGSGYPCLGTFYKHVKESGGVFQYMRGRFISDLCFGPGRLDSALGVS